MKVVTTNRLRALALALMALLSISESATAQCLNAGVHICNYSKKGTVVKRIVFGGHSYDTYHEEEHEEDNYHKYKYKKRKYKEKWFLST